jgi:hypothetical protein
MVDKQTLAKVTGELTGPRGPDVRSRITVPATWIRSGGQLHIARPRLASCEQCSGGGCAVCGYQGAFALSDRGCDVCLQLAAQDTAAIVTVRLPNLGVKRENDEEPGHWLVEVHAGPAFSAGVRLVETSSGRPSWRGKIVAMAVALAVFWAWLSLQSG